MREEERLACSVTISVGCSARSRGGGGYGGHGDDALRWAVTRSHCHPGLMFMIPWKEIKAKAG